MLLCRCHGQPTNVGLSIQVALSKSVFLLMYPMAMLEADVGAWKHKEPRAAAAATRAFWDSKLPATEPGGKAWRAALEIAHREEPSYDELLAALGTFVQPG